MHPLGFLLLPPLVTLAVALLLWPLRWILVRRAVLDRPNERSSHAVPTPRGGGLVLVPVVLLLWAGLARHGALPGYPGPVLLAALALLLVSFLDDLRGLPAGLRFALHLLAVVAGLLALPADWMLTQGLLPRWADLVLAGFAWLWLTELTNFMDGIDGISGVELGSVAFGLALLAALGLLAPGQGLAALLLLAALLGFLAWNWSPAALFLGDVGSVPLGFLVGWLLLLACGQGLWPVALILPAYYWADATLTLLRRLARGEKIWQAHRGHLYQRALASLTHGQVAAAILLANLGLVAAAVIAADGRAWVGLGLAVLLTAGLLLWLARRARRA
jgi:UDP-N-acetylmuramyl pentapeptide phosphotransferase/UDP-N-acetylglucosamine-1-phosphate transferase